MSDDHLRSKLAAAYGQLKHATNKAEYITWAIDSLANGAEPDPSAKTAVNIKTAANIGKELTDVANQAARLATTLSDLHWLSRLTLAEQAGIAMVSNTGDWLAIIGRLRRLSAVAKQASADADPHKWRLPEGRAQTVAKILAHDFEQITGKLPTRVTRHDKDLGTGKSFADLVKNVFDALVIDANADHFARKIVKERMEVRPAK